MNTRKCSKCGWEYPIDWPGRTCRFCHEPFKDGFCSYCGKWSDKLHNTMCRACHTYQHKVWRDGRKFVAEESYEEWTFRIKDMPIEPLTESQWLEACNHFKGCAYCGADSIDARSMFIPYKDGGRYTRWNIVPSCERCETARKVTTNPFLRMDDSLNRSQAHQARKYGFSMKRLQSIVDYLQSKMEVNK